MAEAATESTRTSWGDHLEDVQISTGGRALFDERAERTIRDAGSRGGGARAQERG
jgi:putative ABC transport system permease protein